MPQTNEIQIDNLGTITKGNNANAIIEKLKQLYQTPKTHCYDRLNNHS